MTRLHVPGMTCGHCKASIESAIARLDPEATVKVDLATRIIEVEGKPTQREVVMALDEIGFLARKV